MALSMALVEHNERSGATLSYSSSGPGGHCFSLTGPEQVHRVTTPEWYAAFRTTVPSSANLPTDLESA